MRTLLRAELTEISERIRTADRTRDMDLQDAANALAMEWKQNNRMMISKREIAKELAKSDEWKGISSGRIERIIRKKW